MLTTYYICVYVCCMSYVSFDLFKHPFEHRPSALSEMPSHLRRTASVSTLLRKCTKACYSCIYIAHLDFTLFLYCTVLTVRLGGKARYILQRKKERKKGRKKRKKERKEEKDERKKENKDINKET